MTQQTDNLRVRRTQKLLREALIELIEERGFEALTIAEITERAMVSRAAFYRNYHDKYELVEQIFAEAIRPLLSAVEELGTTHPAASWVQFFEHIAAYDRLYRALLGKKGSPWFAQQLRAALKDLMDSPGHQAHASSRHPPAGHTRGDDLIPALVSALFVETITWWLEYGRHLSVQAIATQSSRLAAALFQEGTTWMPGNP